MTTMHEADDGYMLFLINFDYCAVKCNFEKRADAQFYSDVPNSPDGYVDKVVEKYKIKN